MAQKITQTQTAASMSRRPHHPVHRRRRHRRRHLARRQARSRCGREEARQHDRVARSARRREGVQQDGRLVARRDHRQVPRIPHRYQGPTDHADRWWLPFAQRRAAPDPRSVCVLAPGALVPGRAVAGEASREGRHGDLPRELRRHLCRPRSRGVHARGQEAARVARRIRSGGTSAKTPASASSRSRSTARSACIRAAINYAIDQQAASRSRSCTRATS